MIQEFLQFQTYLRLYHWRTASYARHVASGSLYEKLDPLIDAFIEVSQGQVPNSRISYKPFRLEGKAPTDREILQVMKQFVKFLSSMKIVSSDLYNLRDEMLSEVKRTVYLFSLN